jgi:hypothetical protein
MVGILLSACIALVLLFIGVLWVWRRYAASEARDRLASATDTADPARRSVLPRLAATFLGLWALRPKSGAAHAIRPLTDQPLTDEDFDLDVRLSDSRAKIMQAQSRTDCCRAATYSPTCGTTCPASCHGSCGASCTPTCRNTCAASCQGTCGGASCAPTCTQACRIRQTLNACPVPPPR